MPKIVLTLLDVADIKQALASGASRTRLAQKYGCSRSCIGDIASGRTQQYRAIRDDLNEHLQTMEQRRREHVWQRVADLKYSGLSNQVIGERLNIAPSTVAGIISCYAGRTFMGRHISHVMGTKSELRARLLELEHDNALLRFELDTLKASTDSDLQAALKIAVAEIAFLQTKGGVG